MPALTKHDPFPQPGFDRYQSPSTHAAIINSLGATKPRLVAPSALVPSLLHAGHDLLPCLPAYCQREEDGVEEARRWGAVMIFGDANSKSLFA